MKHFFVITNQLKDKNLQMTEWIAQYIRQSGGFCETQARGVLEKAGCSYTNADAIPADTECILVLGGDGTLIEAARDTAERDIPLLGINLGTLGFLAEVEQSQVKKALDMLLYDEYNIEKRMMIEGRIYRAGQCVESSCALNDIVITRNGALRIINFHIYVNGQFLNTYGADGVIISTPTGSTGYNMSAGGPIVEPKASLMVITPICPHTLNTRSIVLAAEDEITVEIASDYPGKEGSGPRVEASFDGGHAVGLGPGQRIVITRSGRTTDIVKLNKVSFLEVLHKKMSEK